MDNPESVEQALTARLRPAQVPPANDTWRRLTPALFGQSRSGHSRRRVLQVGGGALLTVLATVSLALASSPQLRQQLGVLSGVGGSGSHLSSLQPSPSFPVLQPPSLPSDWRLLVRAYNPNQAKSGRPQLPVPMLITAGSDGKVDAALAQAATEQAQRLLGDGATPTLVLIYATNMGQLVDLVEQSGQGRSVPAGTPVAIHQARGVVTQDGANAVLTWIEQGTWVEVHTPLGQAAALQFADRLQASAMANAGSAQVPTGQPALATRVPLAQSAAAVTTPTIADAALASRCGAWQAEPDGHLSIAGSQQAACVAKAVAGAGNFPSVGVSVLPWQDAAAHLGLDPARGPAGNPLVLAVDLENGTGVAIWQVILDKGTGHPYVLVQLKPGQ